MEQTVLDLVGELDFDPAALKEKYLAERDKRIRDDGIEQYIEVKAEFSHYIDDPYVEPGFTREALNDTVEVAIIGGGFIEQAGDFGGTWYWNRYPGAMCDVESYCYLPLLEEMGYVPKHKYAFAPEILEYSRKIARHYGLYDNACMQTSVTELRWDEDSSYWHIQTDRGDNMRARFVAMANGQLSRPKLPGIPGINDYKGHTFHTSRWDYNYTGGDSHGNLSNLRDKRVGIIGTGATAVQAIPHLGECAKELYVFQRTPSSIDVRNNAPTDPDWAASLEPGWQQARMENFNVLVSGGDQDEDLVGDGWTEIMRKLTGIVAKGASKELGRRLTKVERAELMELSDYQKMNQVRARVDSIIPDEATAEALKPWYRQFCKRPCFHDEYLDTYNRDNVTLVDTKGKGVERFTDSGVVVDGQSYDLDCIVFATGFEVGRSFTRRAGYDIIGKNSQTLSDHWSNGVRSLHGMTTHGFPNCFFLGSTQAVATVNFPHALSEQAEHLAFILAEMKKRNKTRVQPSAGAEAEYVAEVHRLANSGTRFYAECTPGYYNSEGAPGNKAGAFSDMYGGGSIRFFRMLEKWREEGTMPGFELS